jgi:hypothetical protein
MLSRHTGPQPLRQRLAITSQKPSGEREQIADRAPAETIALAIVAGLSLHLAASQSRLVAIIAQSAGRRSRRAFA